MASGCAQSEEAEAMERDGRGMDGREKEEEVREGSERSWR